MIFKIFGEKQITAEETEKTIARSRKQVLRNKLDSALNLLKRAEAATNGLSQTGNSSDPRIEWFRFQIGLVNWAVRYRLKPASELELDEVLGDQKIDFQTAHFIGKLLQPNPSIFSGRSLNYKALKRLNNLSRFSRVIVNWLRNEGVSQTSIEVLAYLANEQPHNMLVASLLCRWYWRTSQVDAAIETAHRILRYAPDNSTAHRCLAISAELAGEWLAASKHYEASGDYLRAAVAHVKIGNLPKALELLVQIPEEKRGNSTWLYHHGWVMYQQGDAFAALSSWSRLTHDSKPNRSVIEDVLVSLKKQVLDDKLRTFKLSHLLMQQRFFPDNTFLGYVALQMGATKLVLGTDIQSSVALLEHAVRLLPGNPVALSYLMLAQSFREKDAIVDESDSLRFLDYSGSESLYKWLRGLYLLREGKVSGFEFVHDAQQVNHLQNYIPDEAVAAFNAISKLIASEDSISARFNVLEGPSDLTTSLVSEHCSLFYRAISASYTWYCLHKGDPIAWIDAEPHYPVSPSVWNRLQIAHSLREHDWSNACRRISDLDSPMKIKLAAKVLKEAIQDQEWTHVAECLHLGSCGKYSNSQWDYLRPRLYRELWQRNDLETLRLTLEDQVRSGNADTKIYHYMAIVCTKLAIDRDNQLAESDQDTLKGTASGTDQSSSGFLVGQFGNKYWPLAIGYWSVAFTDESYWSAGARRRVEVYGEKVEESEVRQLVGQSLPLILRNYHEDEFHRGSPVASDHRFYGFLIQREIELTNAVRHLIRVANRESFELSGVFTKYISPLLMKQYGYEVQVRERMANIAKLPLSPYEADLLHSAFSPLATIKALVSVRAYDMALKALKQFLSTEMHEALRNEVHQELMRVLELAAEEAVQLERWQSALMLFDEARNLHSIGKDFERLTSIAVSGLANELIRQDKYSEAFQQLGRIRSLLRHRNADLEALMSETYVDWAHKIASEGDLQLAISHFDKAIEHNPNNDRAKHGLNIVYFQRAADRAEKQQDYTGALKDAETALYYHEDAETIILVSKLHRAIAIKLEEQKQRQAAEYYWEQAWEYAKRQVELGNKQENLNFLVEIGLSRVLSFYSINSFRDAIRLAEALEEMPYDRDALKIDLRALLSEMYTNLGAEIYNKGNHWEGKKLMQRALDYDPNNQVARSNLYRL